ncbi:nitronate monooxygenase, partial [Acinetobacter baumannii]
EVELAWIDAHVDGKPYGVDVVMPAKYEGSDQGGITKEALEAMLPQKHREFVRELLARFEVPELPAGEKIESLLGWTE